MTGWRLGPLGRVRRHQARAAARDLAEALEAERQAAAAVARRLREEAAACEGLGGGPGDWPRSAAALAAAAACVERHAQALEEARAVARRADDGVREGRERLLEARAGVRTLDALEARWSEARRRRRLRAEEAELDDRRWPPPR